MPIYDYRCSACNKDFEIIQKITADPLTKCEECNQETLRKQIQRTAPPIFHGPGFYNTDYKRKPRK